MKNLLTVLIVVLAAFAVAVAQNPPTQAPATDAANAPAAAPAPKRPGVIRLGLVQPKLDMGIPGAAPEALRTLLTQYLTGPQIEVVPIAAMIPLHVEAEAKQKECNFLFYASLSQKRGRGFGFLRGAQSMTSMVPVIGMAGGTGAIVGRAAAMTAINAASQLSSEVKAKSEVTLQYQLVAPGAASPLIANADKVKAESDGQDVITPLVEQAATAVTTALLKKQPELAIP
jgi:hypothetical protein